MRYGTNGNSKMLRPGSVPATANHNAMAVDSFTLKVSDKRCAALNELCRRIMRQTIEHRHPLEADHRAEFLAATATVAVLRSVESR